MFWDIKIAELIQIFISALGLGYIVYQIVCFWRSRQAQAHACIYAQYLEVCKTLQDNKDLYPYFYEQKDLPIHDSMLMSRINLMCETIFGLIEHVALQKDSLPDDSWEKCWGPYTRERLNKSPAMRRYFWDNRAWYTEVLNGLIGECMEQIGRRADGSDRVNGHRALGEGQGQPGLHQGTETPAASALDSRWQHPSILPTTHEAL